MNRNRPLFENKEQLSTIEKFQSLTESLEVARTAKEWNALRQRLNDTFPGNRKEKLMLFGYIDGVLHSKVFQPTSEARIQIRIQNTNKQ